MKAVPAALAAHLSTGTTTLAYCWRVTRTDGVVLGFTEHDNDLAYAGTDFQADSGLTASQIQQSLDLSVDNLTAAGALSSATITETDILARRYDDAVVELFWVNWADPTQGITIAVGNLGEVTRAGIAFSAEFRSIANRLNQKIGTTCERFCSAKLGDARCKVDLTASTLKAACASATAGLVSEIAMTGLSTYAADWFTFGTLTFSGGANAGLPIDVKAHLRTSGIDILQLWMPTPFAVAVGDAAVVLAGCRKSLATCQTKFANVPNFRGFPFIPGADVVTRYAVQGALDASGGSLFAGT
jgi:uncharacterized phage protein (TIGR02218 family)